MVNLFKEDKTVNDSQFKQYLSQKINDYDEGGQIDEDRLLALAKDKYKTLVCSGEWKSPYGDQKEIQSIRTWIGIHCACPIDSQRDTLCMVTTHVNNYESKGLTRMDSNS